MIEQISLRNFKVFAELDLPLRRLTLLSGLNGMGKSTLLQALLVMRQSYQSGDLERGRLRLNGPLVELGTAGEVRNDRALDETIEIGLKISETEQDYRWRFGIDKSDADTLRVVSRPDVVEEGIALFGGNVQYIQAERLGPRLLYPASDYEVRVKRWLGRAGEYAAHFLHALGDNPVLPSLVYEPDEKNNLLAQTAAWLGVVSPMVTLRTEFITGTDMVKLQFGYGGREHFRPTNVGFGLSYALPIIVALLSANQGTLLLLENPEAHLHPRGQSELGQLIARAAAAGVQVVVETHSDHVLNGIRVSVREDEEEELPALIKAEDVALHFFQRDANDVVQVISPKLDNTGRFESATPLYFFDEHRRNMRKLL